MPASQNAAAVSIPLWWAIIPLTAYPLPLPSPLCLRSSIGTTTNALTGQATCTFANYGYYSTVTDPSLPTTAIPCPVDQSANAIRPITQAPGCSPW